MEKGVPERPRREEPPPWRFEFISWWTRTQRIRTVAAVPIEVAVLDGQAPPLYQRVAAKASHLHELGMTQAEIGRRLGVDRWTVGKALRWMRGVPRS